MKKTSEIVEDMERAMFARIEEESEDDEFRTIKKSEYEKKFPFTQSALFNSFCLEGKITEQHAEEIKKSIDVFAENLLRGGAGGDKSGEVRPCKIREEP